MEDDQSAASSASGNGAAREQQVPAEPELRLEVLSQVAEVLEAKHLRHSLSASSRAELLQIDAFHRSLAQTRVVAVVGAGASSTRYPRGTQLLEQIRNEFGDRFTAQDIDLIGDISARDAGFESTLSALSWPASRGHAVRRSIASTFSVDRPTTLTYELLAHLLKHRYLDAVINFNFDELLDHSIRTESGDGEYRFVVSDRDCDDVVSDPELPDYLPLYIKPHGTASAPDSMRFTLEDYFSPSRSARDLITRVFGTGPLLILNFGYGLADPDFCALLRRPARVSIVDCSYVPIRDGALDEIRRSAGDHLDDVRVEGAEPRQPSMVNEVEISRIFGVDQFNGGARRSPGSTTSNGDATKDFREYSNSLRRRGRRLTYYWLDHAWISSALPAEGTDDILDPDITDHLPLSFVGKDSQAAARGLRRRYVRHVIANSSPRRAFDPGALQLLDLVSYLDDRSRPTRPATSGASANGRRRVQGPTHYYRSEARHLAVGLFCEFSTLSRNGVDDPKSYWRDRALLELAMFMVESGGQTTSEDLAVSRARRYFDRYRAFGGVEQFHDIYALLEIREGSRGIRYLGAASRQKTWRTTEHDVIEPYGRGDERGQRLSLIEENLRDRGFLRLSMPNAVAVTRALARNLFRHCSTVEPSLQAEFLDYIGRVLHVLAVARMGVEIASRDDRVCTGIFRSPVKLGSHTALSAYSKLALARLRSEPQHRPGVERGRSELWISTTTGGFLSDNAFLWSGLEEFGRRTVPRMVDDQDPADNEHPHHRAVDVRLVCSAAELAAVGGPADLSGRIRDSIGAFVGDHGQDCVNVDLRFLPWWQVTRHMMLTLVDRSPVAGVYFVRQRLSRVISPVYVTDPDDLSVLHAMFRRMWAEGVDIGSQAEHGHVMAPVLIGERDFIDLGLYDHDGAGERRTPERRIGERRTTTVGRSGGSRSGQDRRSGPDRRS